MNDIIFADDDPAMREMVAKVFGVAGYQVRLAEHGQAALDQIARATPDLVILDYRMGVPDGLEVCRTIKADPRLEHLPVLILTGQSEIENRLAGFEAGADDYLAKPFDPRELLARARAMLMLARRGRDRNPTSGLPGGEAMYRDFERWRHRDTPFCICYLDLDYFKPFGDRFGFAVADEVIREVGNILASVAKQDQFVGHVGGDDFVLFTDCPDARNQVEHAQARLRETLLRILPPEDTATGSYRSVDREGVEREFPLTRLTAAILRVQPGSIDSLLQLSEVVAEAKRQAKLSAEGLAEHSYPPTSGSATS